MKLSKWFKTLTKYSRPFNRTRRAFFLYVDGNDGKREEYMYFCRPEEISGTSVLAAMNECGRREIILVCAYKDLAILPWKELTFSADIKFQIYALLDTFSGLEPADKMGEQEMLTMTHGLTLFFQVNTDNTPFLDDVLEWCGARHGISPIFVFDIRDQLDKLKNEQIFHLQQFFSKLAATPQIDFPTRSVYSGYSEILGSQINSDGNKSILAGVRFPETGGLSDDHPFTVLLRTFELHWSHSGVTAFLFRNLRKKIEKQFRPASKEINSIPPFIPGTLHITEWEEVLITGWYGTETGGDKAILGEVIDFVKRYTPNCRITVTTVNHVISEQTKLELPLLRDSRLIDISEGFDREIISKTDAVIFGGGPIMDSGTLGDILKIFVEANKQKKARVIFGCGVGPLNVESSRKAAAGIIKLATHGFYRDLESKELAREITGEDRFPFACDPALAFVSRWRRNYVPEVDGQKEGMTLSTLLRANTKEFVNSTASRKINDTNWLAAERISQILAGIKQNVNIQLLHMNAPVHGGDDRLFNRLVVNSALSKSGKEVNLIRTYHTLDQLLKAIADSDATLAMRYHGHIFSLALGKPFLSIDYTGKRGKVKSLLKRINYEKWSEVWEELEVGNAQQKLASIFSQCEELSELLLIQADALEKRLYEVYQEVFNIKYRQ